jgi:hypothetical protein
MGFLLYNMVDDGQLLSACFKAYNDWLADSVALSRPAQGVALINLDVRR